jgi:hypothetical protein
VYDDAKRDGIKILFTVYERAIAVAAKQGNIPKMEEIHSAILNDKLRPSIYVHNSLIEGYQVFY